MIARISFCHTNVAALFDARALSPRLCAPSILFDDHLSPFSHEPRRRQRVDVCVSIKIYMPQWLANLRLEWLYSTVDLLPMMMNYKTHPVLTVYEPKMSQRLDCWEKQDRLPSLLMMTNYKTSPWPHGLWIENVTAIRFDKLWQWFGNQSSSQFFKFSSRKKFKIFAGIKISSAAVIEPSTNMYQPRSSPFGPNKKWSCCSCKLWPKLIITA